MKPLVIALSGTGREWGGGGGDHLTNIQCKAIQNGHSKSAPNSHTHKEWEKFLFMGNDIWRPPSKG
jgi:hypothetical protein